MEPATPPNAYITPAEKPAIVGELYLTEFATGLLPAVRSQSNAPVGLFGSASRWNGPFLNPYSPLISIEIAFPFANRASTMKSYWLPSVMLPKRSLSIPTYALRPKIPVPMMLPFAIENWFTSANVARYPPPRSSVPRKPNRFGVKMPSSNLTFFPPPSLLTYEMPLSIRPNKVTLLCAYAPCAMTSIAAAPNLSFMVSPSFFCECERSPTVSRVLDRCFVKQRLPQPGFSFIRVGKLLSFTDLKE